MAQGLGGILGNMFGMGQPQAQQPGAMSDPMQGMGLLGRMQYLQQNNPEALMALGSGMMQGNMAGGFAAAGDQMAQHREKAADQQKTAHQENMTKRWLMANKGMDEQQAAMAMSNPAILGSYLKGGPDPTDDIREFEYGLKNPQFTDYMTNQKKAGATSIHNTVGGGKYGTIPQGYELLEGPEGASMRPIPGGPEDTSKKDAAAQGQSDVATRVVTSAAQRARDAAKQRAFGHVGQGVVSNLPWTDAAEVARQVEVLKSTAKVENLTAMRAASPTGGALGSVTEKEADMLAAKSGALDPNSPNFERDLDDYELTLLQVVHGPQEGARIFSETRSGGGQTVPPPAGGRLRFNPATGELE
jgi:hypothetical protein